MDNEFSEENVWKMANGRLPTGYMDYYLDEYKRIKKDLDAGKKINRERAESVEEILRMWGDTNASYRRLF